MSVSLKPTKVIHACKTKLAQIESARNERRKKILDKYKDCRTGFFWNRRQVTEDEAKEIAESDFDYHLSKHWCGLQYSAVKLILQAAEVALEEGEKITLSVEQVNYVGLSDEQ